LSIRFFLFLLRNNTFLFVDKLQIKLRCCLFDQYLLSVTWHIFFPIDLIEPPLMLKKNPLKYWLLHVRKHISLYFFFIQTKIKAVSPICRIRVFHSIEWFTILNHHLSDRIAMTTFCFFSFRIIFSRTRVRIFIFFVAQNVNFFSFRI
jgi:hypothetical protein